jgi:uncharacterized protein YndB with AHSA1/START domain
MSAPRSRVEVERRLRATAEEVFALFASRARVAQWLRPASEVKLTVLEFDFRVGGAYRFAYDVPDGRRMIVGGHYRVIDRPTRIVFSWVIEPPDEHAGIDSEVTATLASTDDGTVLVIVHDRFGRADAEARHAAGWNGALDLMGELLTAGGSGHGDR